MQAELRQFMKQPFSEDMSAAHWAAFILFLICVVALWKIILAHITGSI